jgi:uncharacterized protein YoxC
MDGFWTPGELAAVIGIALAVLAQFVTGLRFLYRMEGRVDNLASGMDGLKEEVHGLRSDVKEEIRRLSGRTDTLLGMQETVRNLTDRVGHLERRRGGS